MRWIPWSACLMLFAPLAQAGTAEDPEIVDPAGDTWPPPAGLEWADILAVWFEVPSSDKEVMDVGLHVKVARIDAEPPGRVAAAFQVDGHHYVAGWTFTTNGAGAGFACNSDQNGEPVSACGPLTGTRSSDGYVILLPAERFGFYPGTNITSPWGFSASLLNVVEGTPTQHIEMTEVGRDVKLPGGRQPLMAPADAGNSTNSTDGESIATEAPASKDTPLPGVVLAAAALAAAMARRRR